MRDSPRVLLAASLDAIGTSRMPKLLSRAGFHVSLFAPAGNVTHRSRYVSERIRAEGGPGRIAESLRSHLEANPAPYDWVIFSDEPVLWAAAELPDRGWLERWFPVPMNTGVPGLLTSKIDFLVESRRRGLPAPQFELCRNGDEVMDVAGRIGFPVFVKASQGLAGSGLRFAQDATSLRSQLSAFPPDAGLMLQETIDGRSGSISVLYDHGRPVCWFGYLMRETWPNRFAAACVIETFDHPDVELLVNGIGAMTQFHGFSGIDWVHDAKRNRLALLEFNPRPTPVFYQGPAAGVDFSEALRQLWSGRATVQKPRSSGVVVPLFPQNLYRSIDDARPWSACRTFADACWDDPNLTLAHLRRVATHYVPGSWKQSLKGALP